MSNIRLLLILVMCQILPALLPAQQIDSMLAIYADKFQQEKAYVQFDKQVYNPGETIWFKVYVFAGNAPSLLSKNFFAELWDASGHLVQRKMMPLVESSAANSFEIPETFAGSRLHVRAYTTWMLNFDTAFIFEKNFRVINKTAGAAPSARAYQLNFFPEGGDLVAGVESNIAFKSNDENGLPMEVSGTIRDAAGKQVGDFYSSHDGMGKFLLQPEIGDILHAEWKDSDGKDHKTDLPPVKRGGVVLKLLAGKSDLYFSLARSSGDHRYDQLKVIAQINQQVVYKAAINLKETSSGTGRLSTNNFASGVLTFTVFDANDVPLAERIIFINTGQYAFSSRISINTTSLQPRAENKIEITVPDSMTCNLSMSVTDVKTDGHQAGDDDIISHLLLTGDLRGYVYDPAYYFSNGSDSIAQQLDLVMLTHGWRRFAWDQLAQGKTPLIKFPLQPYITISGTLTGINPAKIATDESLTVFLHQKNGAPSMITIPHTVGPNFVLSGLSFSDTAKAYYKFSSDRRLSAKGKLQLTTDLFAGYSQVGVFDTYGTDWHSGDSALIKENMQVNERAVHARDLVKNRKTLATVTVRAHLKTDNERLNENYASPEFRGINGTIFNLLNDPTAIGYPGILSYLQSKVAGLQINAPSGLSSNGSALWRGKPTSFYVDENPVDISYLTSINIQDVALLKVFPPNSSVALGPTLGGAIAIYLKKGGDVKADPNMEGLDMVRLIGYSPEREFYKPNYSSHAPTDSADNRTTIYWNPYIVTDHGHSTIPVSFFNSDNPHKLRIVLEGTDESGKLTRLEKVIE